MRNTFIIGTRGSDLALWQAEFVKGRLKAKLPNAELEIKIISTTGDQILDQSLSKIGDKGLFTRQIETALLKGEIDLAVHSLKDLQTEQPEGLTIGAVCHRDLPNDAFISSKYGSIDELPDGATVATGSLRRKCQLLSHRPNLRVVDIRGNVPTRLKKFENSDADAIVLAFAGLHRLGLDSRVKQLIPFNLMLPAVGQGAIAVEVRFDDQRVLDTVAKIDDHETRICITAERAFLRRLEGGCQVPIGALATLEDGLLRLDGMVGSLDGSVVYRESIDGDAANADNLGSYLANILIEKGAGKLLELNRRESELSAGH
ncbi:MAG: hydroxymethylbilane synthase [Pyrinomonadaceae bacterium]